LLIRVGMIVLIQDVAGDVVADIRSEKTGGAVE
jgi:hypothetical protein